MHVISGGPKLRGGHRVGKWLAVGTIPLAGLLTWLLAAFTVGGQYIDAINQDNPLQLGEVGGYLIVFGRLWLPLLTIALVIVHFLSRS